ncbi:DUF2807 domain-containing protein [Echinicola marina]|uniref:GIN domain-containing protein n=1 Tax=Echinicola marina TaxID=2859768 RepID=UPI001CF621E8|nr:DUF2807 domain-containing protein [Echinicola marina]UCS95307.1 DUF2807 domain-containing protein [Echinicola marina]
MKKQVSTIIMLVFMISSINLFAQTNEETRTVSIFDGVKVSNSIEADLVKGDRYEVQIMASGTDVSNVVTEVEGRQLNVEMGKGSFGSNSVKVVITYAGELDEISANSSAKVFVKDMLKSKSLSLLAENSSYIEGKVNVNNLKLVGMTNGKIFVEGTANELDLEAFTKATISGDSLKVKNASVRTNTAAVSTIAIENSIKGTAGTAGKVWYTGDPKLVDVKSNTGGDIARKEN